MMLPPLLETEPEETTLVGDVDEWITQFELGYFESIWVDLYHKAQQWMEAYGQQNT